VDEFFLLSAHPIILDNRPSNRLLFLLLFITTKKCLQWLSLRRAFGIILNMNC